MTKLDVTEIMARVSLIETQRLLVETCYAAGNVFEARHLENKANEYKQELRDMLDTLVTA